MQAQLGRFKSQATETARVEFLELESPHVVSSAEEPNAPVDLHHAPFGQAADAQRAV
jgi:hypothetical protein